MSNSQPARDGETDRGRAHGTARRGVDGGTYGLAAEDGLVAEDGSTAENGLVAEDGSTAENGLAAEDGLVAEDGWTLEYLAPSLAGPIRKTCFWAAIVLPFFYVPLLLVGLTTPVRTVGFFTLLGANLLALYVGHAHRRDE